MCIFFYLKGRSSTPHKAPHNDWRKSDRCRYFSGLLAVSCWTAVEVIKSLNCPSPAKPFSPHWPAGLLCLEREGKGGLQHEQRKGKKEKTHHFKVNIYLSSSVFSEECKTCVMPSIHRKNSGIWFFNYNLFRENKSIKAKLNYWKAKQKAQNKSTIRAEEWRL